MKANRIKLIETYLPLDALARAAANEMRAGTGAPSSLHLWWGNRQVAIAKGLIFAQLVDAPKLRDGEKGTEVHAVLAGLLNGDPLVEPSARELIRASCGDTWPTLYDPFCGVGTMPFAALSLGVPAIGGELNPVAAFVARLATNGLRGELDKLDVTRAIHWVDAEIKQKLKANYPSVKVTSAMAKARPLLAKYVGRVLPVEMWLWARTVPDPNPAFDGCPVPLVTNFVTGAKKGRESWVEVELLKSKKDYRFVVHDGVAPKGTEKGTRQGKADFRSVFDQRPITSDYIREQGRAGRLGVRLMAVFAQGDDGEKVVLAPTTDQERVAEGVVADVPQTPFTGNVRDCAACSFGFANYGELFLPRQRAMLSELGQLIQDYAARGEKERRAAHVLALAYSQFVSWNSMGNTYWNQRQFPRNVFTRQAIPFAWDFVEANPIEASTKRWEEVAHGVAEKFFALPSVPLGTIRAEDVVGAKVESPCVVNTELPYYDNVAYADLADFFYTWLRPVLKALQPDLAVNIASPRAEELTAFAYRHGGREAADAFYRAGVVSALKAVRSRVRGDYPSVFSFDFRSATFTKRDVEPVAAFVEGLVQAGFTITMAWPLKDMRPRAVFGGDAGTGFRSIYFVCRPRGEAEAISRREFVELLKVRMPDYLAFYRLLDTKLEAEDYASAAVAAGLCVYSDYSEVLNADGSRFAVAEVIDEVLKVVEEIKARERAKEPSEEGLRAEIVAALARGEDPVALRRRVYEAYLKAEDSGRLEESARCNELLNEWNDLIEEMQK